MESPNPNPLLLRDSKVVWHPYGRPCDQSQLIPITHGDGALLFDEAGNSYIDAISSWWVNLHGHAHPHLVQAISRQASRVSQAIFGNFTHESAVQLAERLLALLPNNQECVFFSDNGSTAVEVALKLALHYHQVQGTTQRRRFIYLEGAYHGDTFGAMAVSDRGVFTAPFSSHLTQAIALPFPYAGNEEQVLDIYSSLIKAGDIAGCIVEPRIQGAAGMRLYSDQFLHKLWELSRQHNVLIIADEVMTGFGRTGPLFASLAIDQQPDLICLSKGITGGVLPLGVTTMTETIRSAFRSDELPRTFYHAHSFTGNALACAAANASLDLLLSADCIAARHALNSSHTSFVKQLASLYPKLPIRHLGTICAIDIPSTEATGYSNSLRHRLLAEFLKRRVLLRPLGNTVYIIPPYCITQTQLDTVYAAIGDVLATLSILE